MSVQDVFIHLDRVLSPYYRINVEPFCAYQQPPYEVERERNAQGLSAFWKYSSRLASLSALVMQTLHHFRLNMDFYQ